jgi:integrase
MWLAREKLLESIPRDDLAGLRDRALISTMLFSFARVSAVLSLKRQDFYYQGPRRWLRFHEKGGKEHEMPAHHEIEETIDEYLSKVSIEDKQPLFQSVNKTGTALSGRALNRYNAWAAIRKRARNAGFLTPVGCHTWRATGVTVYLENGGRLEHAQQMAAHESPRTTKPLRHRTTKTRLQSVRSSGFNFNCWLVKISIRVIAYKHL